MYIYVPEGEAEKDEAQLRPAERQNQGDFGRFSCEAGQRSMKSANEERNNA